MFVNACGFFFFVSFSVLRQSSPRGTKKVKQLTATSTFIEFLVVDMPFDLAAHTFSFMLSLFDSRLPFDLAVLTPPGDSYDYNV